MTKALIALIAISGCARYSSPIDIPAEPTSTDLQTKTLALVPNRATCKTFKYWDSDKTTIILGYSRWTIYTFSKDGIVRTTTNGDSEIIINETIDAVQCDLVIENGKLIDVIER